MGKSKIKANSGIADYRAMRDMYDWGEDGLVEFGTFLNKEF
jgi:hypothetical protein